MRKGASSHKRKFADIGLVGAVQTYTGRYGTPANEKKEPAARKSKADVARYGVQSRVLAYMCTFLTQNHPASAPSSASSASVSSDLVIISEELPRNDRLSKRPAPSAADLNASLKTNKFLPHALELRQHMVHFAVLPPREARSVRLDEVSNLPSPLKQALTDLGFSHLYSHQVETRNAILAGKDVIITTPTSSGKSLCFNLSIFEQLILHPDQSSALYLFPLNALARDQEDKLGQLNNRLPASDRLKIICLTGSVDIAERMKMFAAGPPHILVTNPDALHYQLHRGREGNKGWEHWREFLRRLRFCVLDEAHTYSGILGGHTSNLMRRLYTNIESLGGNASAIQFIVASATVGNAEQMTRKLISKEDPSQASQFLWIKESGARTPERVFLSMAAQENPQVMAARIISLWIEAGWRSIVFCNNISRATALLSFMQEDKRFSGFACKVRSYYASLPVSQKAKIIEQLKSGFIRCIVSTNALEAGVDIPELDAVMLLGYPGNKMSFWQRIGRAGRGREGLAVFVPSSNNALDMYYSEHPEDLLNNSMERVAFNSNYPTILGKHLWCACVESGIESDDATLEHRYSPMASHLIRFLAQRGDVALRKEEREGTMWIGRGYPHREVNMRGGDSFADVRAVWNKNNAIIETMSEKQGAIFMSTDQHSGKIVRFDVLSLDLSESKRIASLCESKYPPGTIVSPLRDNKVTMTKKWGEKIFDLSSAGHLAVTYGWGTITNSVYGCETKGNHRKDSTDHPAFGRTLYKQRYETSHEAPCLRLELDETAKVALRDRLGSLMQALKTSVTNSPDLSDRFQKCRNIDAAYLAIHTFMHQLMAVVPLLLLSSQDVEEGMLHASNSDGYLVDSCDGGTGVCEEIFENFLEFVKKAREYGTSCHSCQKSSLWGCATCLYQHHCPISNNALLAALGSELFLLQERSAPVVNTPISATRN